MDAQKYLELELPRTAFLWPVTGGVSMSVNPLMTSMRLWHNRPITASIFMLIGVLFGTFFAVTFFAAKFVGLRCSDGSLWVMPRKGLDRLPSWFTGWGSWKHQPGLGIQVPLEGATLEWVGRTLIIHQQGNSLQLGRGKVAEQISAFLSCHGLGNAVGRQP